MDRILELKSTSTEFIKRTMLMHEDIFKQQVKELHKLYNLQRKLMLDLKNEMSKIEDPKHKSMINMSTWQQPRREIEFNSINVYGLANDQQRETSGSCSGENSKTILIPIRGLNNVEMAERSSTSKYEDEKMRNNIHRCDEETDVELTLSIGPSNRKKRLKSHKEKEKSFSTTSSKFEECGDASSNAIFNKESATQAYWFSQDLSLNRR